MKPSHKLVTALVALAAVSAAVATGLAVIAPAAFAATGTAGGSLPSDAWSFGLLGAALATGLSSLGAGYAVAKVGTAELFARLLIFVGLAEGIAIYGLIVSILILNRLAA